MTPAKAVVTELAAAGIGLVIPPAPGANLFEGPVRAVGAGIPAKAVFCLTTGGPPPLLRSNPAADDQIRRSAVQVRVRGSASQHGDGEALARACWAALQRKKPAGFISFLVRESEPIYIGQDERGHHEWSLNVECMWEG